MSKLTKLFNSPELFFKDSYKKHTNKLKIVTLKKIEALSQVENANLLGKGDRDFNEPFNSIVNEDRQSESNSENNIDTEFEELQLSYISQLMHYTSSINSDSRYIDLSNKSYDYVNLKSNKSVLNCFFYKENRELFETELLKAELYKDNISRGLLLSLYKYGIHNNQVFREIDFSKDSKPVKVLCASISPLLTNTLKNIDGLNFTNYMRHYSGINATYSYSKLFSTIVDFLEDHSSKVKDVENLLGETNVAVLNSTAINPFFSDIYISNYMLYELFRSPDKYDFSFLKDKSELYWWWLTYFIPVKKLNSNFIPAEILAYYKELSFNQPTLNLPLTKFFHDVYSRTPSYNQRYDILTQVGYLGFVLDSYLHNFSNPINSIFIRDIMEPILSKKIYIDSKDDYITLFDVLYYTSRTQDFYLKELSINNIKKTRADFHQKLEKLDFNLSTLSNFRLHENFNKSNNHKSLTLVGLYYSGTGLGANLRMMSNALSYMGLSHQVYDIERKEYIQIESKKSNLIILNKNCNIFMVNADMIPEHIFSVPQTEDIVNIGFLLWELEEVPETHNLALEFLDEIWVPTTFLEDVYKNYTDTPVRYVGKYINLIPPTKEYIAGDYFRFYMSFDFHSNIERKNPVAAVKAFKKAFRKDEPVKFILKTTDIIRNHPGNHKAQWENIVQEVSNDKRFEIIVGKLPFQDLVNQINSMECIVSSHRSEGFGYLPVHGFLLNKPAIVTDYSGTTDFCNDETAYPVKWSKSAIEPGDFGSVEKGFWAEVDINDMSKKMRDVYRNYNQALGKAQKGKELILSQYSLSAFEENCYKYLSGLNVI